METAAEKNNPPAAFKKCHGLLFTGGEGPDPRQIARVMEQAHPAKNSAAAPGTGYAVSGAEDDASGRLLVAAADSGLLLAESGGIIPDWIIGDMDSLAEADPAGLTRLAAYPPEKILRHPADKDFTDTELAFSLLRKKGCGKIWVIGGGGGRLDQLLGIRSLFERDDPPERWLTASDDIRCIGSAVVPSELAVSGHAPLFPVSVFPVGTGPWEAESSGLKWPLAGLPWARDFIAISNVAPAGTFTIKAKQGRFLVMWPYSHKSQ